MGMEPNNELVIKLGDIVQEFVEGHGVLSQAINDEGGRKALFCALVMLSASVLVGPDEIGTMVATRTAEAVEPACKALLDAWRKARIECN